MFLGIPLISKSLTLDTTVCEMDVVDRDRFSIARNWFIRNSDFVTTLEAYLYYQICGFDRLIAVGAFIPRTSNTTLAIICVIRGMAALDKFYPDYWSCITKQTTHVVFAHMKNPFVFTSCKSKAVCYEDEQRGNLFAFSGCLDATFFQPFLLFSYDKVICSHCFDFMLWSALVPFSNLDISSKPESTESVSLSIYITKVFLGITKINITHRKHGKYKNE